MCERCAEIDGKIQRYRNLIKWIPDPTTYEEAQRLIQDLMAKKAALHLEQGPTDRRSA